MMNVASATVQVLFTFVAVEIFQRVIVHVVV